MGSFRNLPGEKWKLYVDGYYISSCGRWYSSKSKRILKQFPNNKGYSRVQICTDGVKKNTFTHIIVVKMFGDCKGEELPGETLFDFGLSIDHRDRNKKNCRQKNLEIVTHQENCLRKFRGILEF